MQGVSLVGDTLFILEDFIMKKCLVSMFVLFMICFMASCGTAKNISSDEGQSTISVVDSSSEESSEESSDDESLDEESSSNPVEQPMTKEEMLGQAEKTTIEIINDEGTNNTARAQQLFCNKILLLEGTVSNISTDHITMYPKYISNAGFISVNIYLPIEDIANLDTMQKVTIVGKTEDNFDMLTAYLVADTYETTGTLCGKNKSYDNAYNIEIDNNSYHRLIYFADGVEIPNDWAEITFSAKCIGNNYFDAVIID